MRPEWEKRIIGVESLWKGGWNGGMGAMDKYDCGGGQGIVKRPRCIWQEVGSSVPALFLPLSCSRACRFAGRNGVDWTMADHR